MFVQRQYNRSEHDDYVLHVEPILQRETLKESVELRDSNNVLLGWKIQYKYQ